IIAFSFWMERKRPRIFPGSFDPQCVFPCFNCCCSDTQISSGVETGSFIHAESPDLSDWELRDAVTGERRTAIIDADLLAFNGHFSSSSVALCDRGDREKYYYCDNAYLSEIHSLVVPPIENSKAGSQRI